jgi:hypothetical protein
MPFLPSEGEETKLLINEQMRDVLVFHYLPILWYRYPIPNEIRDFWYKERPDILNYMEKAYGDLDIQFLPDKIVEEFQQQKLASQLSSIQNSFQATNVNLKDSISTELLSKDNLLEKDVLLNNLNFLNEQFHNFLTTHFDQLF